jgi:predicted molibdopterin-dependent oxidoreductase YjgC
MVVTVALTLNGEGKLVEFRQISIADIKRCPSSILLASHYRDDGICRHNESTCEVDVNTDHRCKNLKAPNEILCYYHMEDMDPEYIGHCDVCSSPYLVYDNEDHCAICGNCLKHCHCDILGLQND